MAFPDIKQTLGLLGHKVKDKVTGLEGVAVSVCHDLYGCVQVALHPGLDKDGKAMDSQWYDVARVEQTSTERVMEPPSFGTDAPLIYDRGLRQTNHGIAQYKHQTDSSRR
jgi:hypothetical protein